MRYISLIVVLLLTGCPEIDNQSDSSLLLDSGIQDAAPEINLTDGNQEPDAQPEIDSSSRDSSLDVEVTETFTDSQPIDEPIVDSSYPDANEPEVIILPLCICGDNYICRYVDNLPTCICPPGNYINDNEECIPHTCGDGVVYTSHEECDDGNLSNEDGCLNSCIYATCGDGYTQIGVESCDDRNQSNQDNCLNNCELPYCGDGHVHSGVEECDDGNRIDSDECTNSCEVNICGDGIISEFEECDDANDTDYDDCLWNCTINTCGDEVVNIGTEECDLGVFNGQEEYTCSEDCTIKSLEFVSIPTRERIQLEESNCSFNINGFDGHLIMINAEVLRNNISSEISSRNITQAEYAFCVNSGNCPNTTQNQPTIERMLRYPTREVRLTKEEAREYCEANSMRLPSVLEYEYASARGLAIGDYPIACFSGGYGSIRYMIFATRYCVNSLGLQYCNSMENSTSGYFRCAIDL